MSTLAGNPSHGTTDAVGLSAKFSQPFGVAITPDQAFAFIGDFGNGKVRRVELATRAVTTLAADLAGPKGVHLSPDGSFLLVCLLYGHKVCAIQVKTGAVSTLAGSSKGYKDATGTSAQFNEPMGVAVAPGGKYALVSEAGELTQAHSLFGRGRTEDN